MVSDCQALLRQPASLYNEDSLKTFVVVKMITPEEYKQITNVDYAA
ncbi:XkdX family protein [Paenibacillus sp. BR1-192]|nr:XkdX family protein [Paenibacillus sp. BR1-192]WFB57705.1 XkdX family protein [Paenibacillus sp. BR1-192]